MKFVKSFSIYESSKLDERNAFLGARAKAIEEGADEFEFNGKTYKITSKDLKESEHVNEGVGTIALGIMLAYVGIKAIGAIGRKVLGKIGMKIEVEPEKLKEVLSEITTQTAKETGVAAGYLLAVDIKNTLEDKIDSGEIKTLQGLKDGLDSYMKEMNESLVLESEEINEAASWGVEVEEPFSDSKEKAAMSKFKFMHDPIVVVGASGNISDDITDVNIQFSNGDQLEYFAHFAPNSRGQNELTLTKANKEEVHLENEVDMYMGSTGTLIGDLCLIYQDYLKGKIK